MIRHWVRDALDDAFENVPSSDDSRLADLRRIAEIVERTRPYPFRTGALSELADGIDEVTDLEQLAKCLWDVAVAAGFQHGTIFVVRLGHAAAFRHRICTSYPEAWLARYAEKAYQFVDPVVAMVAQSDDPFLFSEAGGSGPVVEAFWADAEAHRIGRHGLCFPVSLPGGAKAGVSFASASPEAIARRNAVRHRSDLFHLSRQLVDTFAYFARISSGQSQSLAPIELRFLHMLLTSEDPQEALRLTPAFGSAKSIQTSIKRKLGVSSVFQAVGIASAAGWFDDLPYERREVSHAAPGLAGWQLLDELEGRGGEEACRE